MIASTLVAQSAEPGAEMSLNATLSEVICCPCPEHGELLYSGTQMACSLCGRTFAEMHGRASLIDEARSIFRNSQVQSRSDRRLFSEVTGWKYKLRQWLPATTERWEDYNALGPLLPLLPANPKVLVLGCGFTRQRYESAFGEGLVLTDVTLLGDADIAADGHCLPFKTEVFDLVIADQVIEHVLKPNQVVQEMNVYSGIPFYFHCHGFPYDFQRYTPLGHRLLYPQCETISLSLTGGPVGALSITLMGVARIVSKNLFWNRAASLLIRLATRPFAWLDRRLRSRTPDWNMIPLGSVFVGKKVHQPIAVEELASSYIRLTK
jgi:hypothetical protein